MNNIPQAVQLSFALIGLFFVLDKTWTALTQFYFQRKLMFEQRVKPSPDPYFSPERDLEERRIRIRHEHASAMIQLMRVTGYTTEIAHNAVKEIFKYAEGEAEKRHPYPEYWGGRIETKETSETP